MIIKPQQENYIDSYSKQKVMSSFNFECIDVSTVKKIKKHLASKIIKPQQEKNVDWYLKQNVM